MASRPAPETPHRQHLVPSRSAETLRVGMHLYQNEQEDDDVSVLTFHTMGTKDTNATGGSNSGFVRAAREALERMMLEGIDGEDGGESLTRISEEGGSSNSSNLSASRSLSPPSRNSLDRSYKSSRSTKSNRSPISAATKRFEADEVVEPNTHGNGDCDDDITVAESILDSANKVLSSIGSSPYYAGRNKKGVLAPHGSLSTQPNQKQPSSMKQPTKTDDTTNDAVNVYCKKIHNMKKESTSPKKSSSDDENRLEVSSNFLSSYFDDENTKPSDKRLNQSENNSFATSTSSYKSINITQNDKNLRRLESETKQLQLLLKERQLETKKASKSLETSIKKAQELLRKYEAGS